MSHTHSHADDARFPHESPLTTSVPVHTPAELVRMGPPYETNGHAPPAAIATPLEQLLGETLDATAADVGLGVQEGLRPFTPKDPAYETTYAYDPEGLRAAVGLERAPADEQVDFRQFVSESKQTCRPLIPFVLSTPFADPVMGMALATQFETRARRITGFVSGLVWDEAARRLVNPTQGILLEVGELYGRPVENLIIHWMREYTAAASAVDGPCLSHELFVEVLFVEPDPTGLQALSVWRALLYPVATGHREASRDFTQQAAETPPLEIQLKGHFFYNEAPDMDLAQALMSELNAVADIDVPTVDWRRWTRDYRETRTAK